MDLLNVVGIKQSNNMCKKFKSRHSNKVLANQMRNEVPLSLIIHVLSLIHQKSNTLLEKCPYLDYSKLKCENEDTS
jgi:hypothetical protein